MFCYQCEQTAKGTGCTVQGVCGKMPEIAALQDLLLYSLMGLSQVAVEGRKVGVSDNDVNVFTVKAAFSTLTNVDFDPDRFMDLIRESITLREKLKTQVGSAGGEVNWSEGPATFEPETSLDGLVKQGEQVGIKTYPGDNPDILSLKHTVLYGIKGVSAYSDHALVLGQEDFADCLENRGMTTTLDEMTSGLGDESLDGFTISKAEEDTLSQPAGIQ
ncbi:MAG: hypothetical protein HOD17_14880, partial [Desulfobacteraceae bacterium]|nr:hypothetical protein [Desulfobacteraceae bacterium]